MGSECRLCKVDSNLRSLISSTTPPLVLDTSHSRSYMLWNMLKIRGAGCSTSALNPE